MVIAWSPYTVCIGSKRGANADIHYFREYALLEGNLTSVLVRISESTRTSLEVAEVPEAEVEAVGILLGRVLAGRCNMSRSHRQFHGGFHNG
jgi:hypothetical protein